jgi:hypothetical protein
MKDSEGISLSRFRLPFILQKLKSFLEIQRDMTVQITSKMMMEGAVKARKRGINLNIHFPFVWSVSLCFSSEKITGRYVFIFNL